MLRNVFISSYLHPHSPTFAETIFAVMPSPAFTAVISVPPWQSSSSSAQVCTALLHLSQDQGLKRWSPWLGMAGLTLAAAGLQSGILTFELPHPRIELPHPPHWATTYSPLSYHIPTIGLPHPHHWATTSPPLGYHIPTHWATTSLPLSYHIPTIAPPHPHHWASKSPPLGYHIPALSYHIPTIGLPHPCIELPHPLQWATTSLHWATTSLPLGYHIPALSYHIPSNGLPHPHHWATTSPHWATTSPPLGYHIPTTGLPHPQISLIPSPCVVYKPFNSLSPNWTEPREALTELGPRWKQGFKPYSSCPRFSSYVIAKMSYTNVVVFLFM